MDDASEKETDIEVSVAICMTDDEYISVVDGIGVTIIVNDASIVDNGGKNVLVVESEV